jgi:DNA-binding MarR family transcriptional regulator
MKKPRAPRPARKLSKPEYEQLAHFRYHLRRFLRFSEDATHARGITSLQYLLMLQIKGYPGREWATVGELAERLQAKHHGVVSLVTRCEEAGLVRRSASADDKRRVEVTLTRAGEKCLEELARLHRNELLSLLDVFPLADLTAVPARREKQPRTTVHPQEKKR